MPDPVGNGDVNVFCGSRKFADHIFVILVQMLRNFMWMLWFYFIVFMMVIVCCFGFERVV